MTIYRVEVERLIGSYMRSSVRGAAAVRHLVRLGLVAIGLAASGCAYDPYTNSYVPCCSYPYPYSTYGSLPPPGPAQPVSPDAVKPGPAPYAAVPEPAAPEEPKLERRFAQANVTRDGMLTYQQAQAAGWHLVVRNFAFIDTGRKGYVTLDDIRAWFAANPPPQAAAPH